MIVRFEANEKANFEDRYTLNIDFTDMELKEMLEEGKNFPRATCLIYKKEKGSVSAENVINLNVEVGKVI